MDLAHQDHRTRWYYVFQNKFLAASLAAVVLGFVAGTIIRICLPSLSENDRFYIGFPGEILMRMFQLVSVPLILTTVLTGVSQRIDAPRKVARNVFLYFGLTTLLATSLGLTLVMMLKPGVVSPDDDSELSDVHGLLDLMRNLVPSNPVQACFQRFKTEKLEFDVHTFEPNSSVQLNDTEVEILDHYIERTNILGLIVCSFIFGLMLKEADEKGKVIVDVLRIINRTTKYVTNLILCYYPVGVLFLAARHVTEVPDWESFYTLGVFMAVVVIGHVIHGAIFLPVIYILTMRKNPWGVLRGAAPALWTALLTASSSATMACTVQCCEQRIGVSHRIVRFVLPLAADINMDGMALYEVIAAVFVAQLNDIHLDFSQLITLGLTSAISTIKGMGIPSTGAVTTFFVLSAVGLPGMEAAILVVVKLLLDLFSTVINVWGDCIALAIMNQLCRNEMEEHEEEDAVRRRRMEAEGFFDDPIFPESSESFQST